MVTLMDTEEIYKNKLKSKVIQIIKRDLKTGNNLPKTTDPTSIEAFIDERASIIDRKIHSIIESNSDDLEQFDKVISNHQILYDWVSGYLYKLF